MSRRLIVGWMTLASLAVALTAGGAQTSTPASPQTAKPATPTAKPSTPQTAAPAPAAKPRTPTSPGAGPVIVVDTEKGSFEFETYPKEAPKTVEHIVALVKRNNFYNGQRFHRVVAKFVVQWGDPATKDMRRRAEWGRGGSGKPIGVAEISKTLKHKIGAVAMGHAGDPARADSQMYVVTGSAAHLDGGYTIFGQVISGIDVVMQIKQDDLVKKMSIRAETPPAK
ncbi:MAG TPA: peptidylprolyl isomerase [Vicinamibacterales bacterium]|nr:peptidylprolyl isomerase [Vicinamibacterales bacterium]